MASGGGIRVDPVEVYGIAALHEQIMDLGISAEVIKAANKAAGELILQRALGEVPVRTGRLRSTFRSVNMLNKVAVRAGMNSVPYANPIHWGWFKRHIKPNPFFSRVLGYSKEEILDNYKRQMDNWLSGSSAKQRRSGRSKVR